MLVDAFGQTASPFVAELFPADLSQGAPADSRRPTFQSSVTPRESSKGTSVSLVMARQYMAVAGKLRGLDDRTKALEGAYKNQAKGPARMTRRIRKDFDPQSSQFGPLEGTTLTPKNHSPELPDVFYLHGGGYSNPPNIAHWWLTAEMAERFGTRIHLMRYPLIPEYTAKETVAQVVESYLAARNTLEKPLIVGGDSAGGGLGLALALTLRDIGAVLPVHLILFAPWIDLTASTPGFDACADRDPMLAQAGIDLAAELYAGPLDRSNPIVSPLFGDPTGLPPTTLILGTSDALYPEGSAWAEKAELAGVDVATFTATGGFHVFPAAYWLPESHAALNYVKQRISIS
ncbi:MAG: alpha/beta hydrolase [Promicromonosporaceae bacterium]|nr:alpha/beta hydrolase [Promicromonosporaceae bacterium]